ncbi:MAG: hypothetical protein GX050_10450 [Firmicutes bacterium]|nr:hypothetical protein [Bacillota bacterium]
MKIIRMARRPEATKITGKSGALAGAVATTSTKTCMIVKKKAKGKNWL